MPDIRRVDLHVHSPHIPTDYRDADSTEPRHLVEAAIAAGLDVIAVTDHFAIDYAERVRRAAREESARTGKRLLVVTGSEVRVSHDGEEVHLVVTFPDAVAAERFRALCAWMRVESSTADVACLPGCVVEADPVEVVWEVDRLGGMSHIAHADRRFGSYRLLDSPLFDRLVTETPIAAVEFIDDSEASLLEGRLRDVPAIRSSDAHAPGEIGRRHTVLRMEELSYEGLRSALRSRFARRRATR